jgi:hypothetical protein
MNLSALKLLLASLAVSSFAVAGCAADTSSDPNAEDAEDTDVSADELTARATQFVGSFDWKGADSINFVEIKQISLKADGTYTGSVDSSLVNPNVRCIAFPCTIPENGKWTVASSGGKLKIKLDSVGPKPTRSYFAEINPQSKILSLTRFGQTTKLFFAGSTCANVKCNASTHCEMKGINGGAIPVCIQNVPQPACQKSGCSGQVCADHSVITTCEARKEFACFHGATCERQADGACGWTQTPALTSCLANP